MKVNARANNRKSVGELFCDMFREQRVRQGLAHHVPSTLPVGLLLAWLRYTLSGADYNRPSPQFGGHLSILAKERRTTSANDAEAKSLRIDAENG